MAPSNNKFFTEPLGKVPWIALDNPVFIDQGNVKNLSWNFSGIPEANNNDQFAVRILFLGKGSAEEEGYHIMDNIRFSGVREPSWEITPNKSLVNGLVYELLNQRDHLLLSSNAPEKISASLCNSKGQCSAFQKDSQGSIYREWSLFTCWELLRTSKEHRRINGCDTYKKIIDAFYYISHVI
jgi:hypothetical protein